MINTDKTEFTQTAAHPVTGDFKIIAELKLTETITVSGALAAVGSPLRMMDAHKHLRALLRHQALGELIPLVMEISSFALKNVPMVEAQRVRELHEQIGKLFAGDETPSKEADTSPRERYWLSVLNVLEPLDYDTTLTFVQILIAKAGPVPDSIGDTVRNLLAAKYREEKNEQTTFKKRS